MTTPLTWHYRRHSGFWLGVAADNLIVARIKTVGAGYFDVTCAGRRLDDPIRCTSLIQAKGVAEANVGVTPPTAEEQTKAFIERARRGEERWRRGGLT